MKKIAIDSRYIGKSGIGRVLSGILDNLDYDNYEFYLVGSNKLKDLYPKANVIEYDTDPFSKKGILKYPKEVNKCDLIFIPNFIIPYGIKIPVYTIIHDLIFLDMKDTTTNGFIDYTLKKHLFKRCVKKSKKIFCVSNFTIGRCKYYFPKYENKYILNYPGLSKEIIDYANNHERKINKDNTIIYVGNVKPHKGIDILLDVFNMLPENMYNLKIIGQKEKFLVGKEFDESKYKNVIFTGRLDDNELLDEIANAKYLIQPSLYEGFGIPPLEALCLGTKPLVSSIDVFKEVYKDLSVIYFKDKEELKDLLLNNNDNNISSLKELLSKYNYKKTTKTIFDNLEV